MNHTTEIKVAAVGTVATLSIWLDILAIPVLLLLGAMVLDYITGLMAARYRGEVITSYRSIRGILKKLAFLIVVAAGGLLDFLIIYVRDTFGGAFPWSFVVAAVIALWLTCNEIISILENVQDMGVPVPSWLLPMVKNIRSKVESQTETEDKE